MPVEFLSPDQQCRYGRYTDDPSPLQLDRYFHFDDRDQQRIHRRRTDHTCLGFALQLGTVRFLGTFLPDPTDVPAHVATCVAHQLGLQARQAWHGTTHETPIGIMPRRFNANTATEIFTIRARFSVQGRPRDP